MIKTWLLFLLMMPFALADDYDDFNVFARQAFGAEKEPLIYDKFGYTLEFDEEGFWIHESKNSAAIAFETNLPSNTYVEYGTNISYGQQTQAPDRPYYIHLHYLNDLSLGTYHYRMVATDERGNTIRSEDRTFTTSTSGSEISGTPPFSLSSGTYVLMEDIDTSGTAFEITGNNVVLDLNGHTVTYNNNNDGKGVSAEYVSGTRILNGIIRQGSSRDGGDGECLGANPIMVRSGGGQREIAGVTVEYSGSQLCGVYFPYGGTGGVEVHHNVMIDRGSSVTNRHGTGVRALIFYGDEAGTSNIVAHHNLVKRTRQWGLTANTMHNNEVYGDSYVTNSGLIVPVEFRGGEGFTAYDNRIFGTGYHPIGFYWGNNLEVHDNLVHMQGQGPENRNSEYGPQNEMTGIRLTQYEGSSWPYNNNVYENNLILISGLQCNSLGCSDGKGVHFYSNENVNDLQFINNIVKVEADASFEANRGDAAPIVTEGQDPDHQGGEAPVYYENNILMSNIANLQFGSNYGGGDNHWFSNNRMVRLGSRSDYVTYRFDDFTWYNENNKDMYMIDSSYEGGSSQDSVEFSTGQQELTFMWTLVVQAASGTSVIVTDKDGNTAASGSTDSSGVYSVQLVQYTQTQSAKAYNAPYRVQVGSLETTIDLEASTRITEDNNQLIVEICVGSCLDEQGCGDGTCDAGETSVNCPADCAIGPVCGDGACDATESCTTCESDCGECPPVCIPMTTTELSTEIQRWKRGEINIEQLMGATAKWKSGCI